MFNWSESEFGTYMGMSQGVETLNLRNIPLEKIWIGIPYQQGYPRAKYSSPAENSS